MAGERQRDAARATRAAWVLLALVVGCGGAPALRWQSTGRASRTDADETALLSRMVAVTPTDDAIAAREAIWTVEGSLGDHQKRALLESSLQWLALLERSGDLDRLRSGACEPTTTGAKQGGDVISTLAGERPESEAPTPRDMRGWAHLGLDLAWYEPHLADASCDRAYRALRALAITRAWLGATVDDVGVLETLDDAVVSVSGVETVDCHEGDDDEIARAITLHLFEFAPFPFTRPSTRDCLRVATLSGPFSDGTPDDGWTYEVGDSSPFDAAAWGDRLGAGVREGAGVRAGEDVRAVEVVIMGWHGGPISIFLVARRGGAWRVIDQVEVGQACR